MRRARGGHARPRRAPRRPTPASSRPRPTSMRRATMLRTMRRRKAFAVTRISSRSPRRTTRSSARCRTVRPLRVGAHRREVALAEHPRRGRPHGGRVEAVRRSRASDVVRADAWPRSRGSGSGRRASAPLASDRSPASPLAASARSGRAAARRSAVVAAPAVRRRREALARSRMPRPGRWHAPRHRFARRDELSSASPISLLSAFSSSPCTVRAFGWTWEPAKAVPSYSITARAQRCASAVIDPCRSSVCARPQTSSI